MLPFSRVCACVLLCFALGCDGPRLESVAPEPGAVDVDANTRVIAEFLLPPDDPTLVVAFPWGASFPGETAIEDRGRRIAFTPDVPLSVGSEYVARLNWTGAKAATVWSFVVGAAQADRTTEAARSANVGSGILRACHPDAPCSNPSQPPLSSAP